MGFHDNPEDAAWIANNIVAIGTALAIGILNFFGVAVQDEDTALEAAVKALYEKGIIKSPDYWIQNAIKGKDVAGEYAAILIKGVAALILKEAI